MAIAKELNCSPAQVAIRWTMQKEQIVIPVIGAKSRTQIEDSLGALNIKLGVDHLQRLNHASEIELGFPHDFLQQNGVKEVVFAGVHEKLINHRKT